MKYRLFKVGTFTSDTPFYQNNWYLILVWVVLMYQVHLEKDIQFYRLPHVDLIKLFDESCIHAEDWLR